ncbi:MAG: transposase [Chloroflexota bacterium]
MQPRRWVIERPCAWFGRDRRLRTDDERLPENSESVVYIGAIRLMLRRLTKEPYFLNTL